MKSRSQSLRWRIRLRKICFLTLAAPALLLNQVPIAVAQNAVALSAQHEWVAGVADEAFQHAEQAWAVCIRNAPGRDERQQNSDWVDEVVMHCARELTHALDVKTAAIWIRFHARWPDLRIAIERAKWHVVLVNQIRKLP